MASEQDGPVEEGGTLVGGSRSSGSGRQDVSLSSSSVGRSLALPSLGFAVLGAALIFIGDDATAHSRIHTSTPAFKVWATLVIGVIAALPAVWRVGVDLLRRLDLEPRRVLRSWAVPAFFGVVVVVTASVLAGQFARGSGSPYYGGIVRISVIYALAVTAAVPTFLAMWECYRQLAGDDGNNETDGALKVNRLLCLRECLLSALTTVGLLVSAGVLIVGAERQTSLADPKYTTPYPSAYVLIWGIGFSALLLVNFLPAFRRLVRLANATIDELFPILPPGSDGWQNRLQERRDLADLLKVTSGARDVVTSSILVAGPLISSAFSLFLPAPPG